MGGGKCEAMCLLRKQTLVFQGRRANFVLHSTLWRWRSAKHTSTRLVSLQQMIMGAVFTSGLQRILCSGRQKGREAKDLGDMDKLYGVVM